MAAEIIPALLVQSAEEFEEKLRLIENHADVVQIDILDGSMFGVESWYDPQIIGQVTTSTEYELHLMVENPLPIIEAFRKHVPSTIRAIIHAELDRPLGTLIELIKQNLKLEVGIALNPETPIDEIHHLIKELDEVLVMGVHPGASGQGFGDSVHQIGGEAILEKIEFIHQRYPNITIGVDGGVNLARAKTMLSLGATRLSVASAIFGADDPVDELRKLQELAAKQG
ncbi:MAG: hypothetical protein ABIG32_03140 [Candidatus Uhrbacteria bacterium]|nr:hypothetical protein [Patescibacteria group bacterium]MBU1906563.1 hypothetical protein [Patescibacteria group bacterium]